MTFVFHFVDPFQTGIEFRDAAYLLTSKNARTLRKNMILNLSLGFTGLTDRSGKPSVNSPFPCRAYDEIFNSYALNLVDTIKVEDAKSTLLTEGVRSPKDTLFFLTQDSEEDAKPSKKAPIAPKNGSPIKQKTAGSKVLRNQRRAVQDEVHQSAMAKMIEHQRELRESLQTRGLERYSEDGGGLAGKEGKGWKKFQSYKGEGALPVEIDKLRVCFPP